MFMDIRTDWMRAAEKMGKFNLILVYREGGKNNSLFTNFRLPKDFPKEKKRDDKSEEFVFLIQFYEMRWIMEGGR